jgi:acetolactate synthase small subunit
MLPARSAGPADRYRAPGAVPQPSFCYSIQAVAEVGVLARLLEICAKRGLVPSRLHSDLVPERDELTIDIQLAALDPAYGEQMARSMREVVGVLQVLTAVKTMAEPPALSA